MVDQQSATAITYKFADPANPGTFLTAATASQIAGRTVAVMPPYGSVPFAPLQIVDRQNGLLSMMIGRNEDLPASLHYQTPWVTYTETISPVLGTSVRIDAPVSGTPPYVTALADVIAAWLSANGLSAAARPALWQRSELRFDISLFSSASLTGRPILRLRNLFIACRNIG